MSRSQIEIIIPFLLYMVVTIAIALAARKVGLNSIAKGKNFMEEFFVGGRSMGAMVLAFTFVATFASAGTFIGYPGLAYQNGLTVLMTGISQIGTMYVAFGILGKRMCVIGHRTGALTFTDVLRSRFDHPLLVIGVTLAILIFFTAFMIGQFSGAARILQSVAGVPYQLGVFLFAGGVGITVVVGGFRAVAWTDTLQGLMMLVGMCIVFPAFIIYAGGFETITMNLLAADPARVFGPGPNDFATPTMLISFWILWVWMAIGNPASTMRFLAAKDTRAIHRGMIIATVLATIFYVPMFYMGAGIYTVFPDIAPDAAIPSAYMASLPAWLVGICLAAPFAAVMSTVDSLLLTMTSTMVRDVYQRYVNPNASSRSLEFLSHGLALALGVLVLVLALTPPPLLATIVIYFAGGVVAAFVVPLLAALYWPRASTWGAVASLFGGLASFLLIDIFMKDPFSIMSYLWGTAISGALMIGVSYVTAPPSQKVVEQFYGRGRGDGAESPAAIEPVSAE